MVNVLKECPENILLMGNLDPVGILKMATPEKIKKEVLTLLENTRSMEELCTVYRMRCSTGSSLGKYKSLYEALNEYNKKQSEL